MKPEHSKAISDYEYHLRVAETSDRRGIFVATHLEVARSAAVDAFGEEAGKAMSRPAPVITDPEARLDAEANAAFFEAHRKNIAALKALTKSMT